MIKRIAALILCALTLAFVFTGCRKEAVTATPTVQPAAPAAAEATAAPSPGSAAANIHAEQIVKLLYSEEIAQWNPLRASTPGPWANWIDTLVEYDRYGMCQPCLAESWERSANGLVWTFSIRRGVPWQYSDGSEYGVEVAADDFVCSIEYILDPHNACPTADQLFILAGAEDYYNDMGRFHAYMEDPNRYMARAIKADPEAVAPEMPDFAGVGVKAVDTHTLEFTLRRPIPYFLSTLTENWGYPTNRAFLTGRGDGFGADYRSILYCGAFLVRDWVDETYRIEDANPLYWDRKHVHIKQIQHTYDAEAELAAADALLRGKATHADIPADRVAEWMADPARAALIRPDRPDVRSYFWLFNFMPTYRKQGLSRGKWRQAANNMNFRKSLYHGLDRIAAISACDPYTPEDDLLRTITPVGFCTIGGRDFTELGSLGRIAAAEPFQPDRALAHRDRAVEELSAAGVSLPIAVCMPYHAGSPEQTALAHAVSQQLEQLLGADYIQFDLEGYADADELDAARREGRYAFMLCDWGPRFDDPLTWTEPFRFGGAYSYIWHADGMAVETDALDPEGRIGHEDYDGRYWKEPKYDGKVDAAAAEAVDLEKRYNALAEAEAWLIDQAFVIPLGMLSGTGYVASYMDPFASQYAPFGASGSRYKDQFVMARPMHTEAYLAGLAAWTGEREARIAAAQAEAGD